jgi:C-terminal processing protease CtpA/Prc
LLDPTMVNWVVPLLCSFLVTSSLGQCVFQNTALTQGLTWTTSDATAVSACFNAVPFSTATSQSTIAQLQNLVNLYSFSDMSANSTAPYNLKVNLLGGLSTIANTAFASDYAFHLALYNLFNGLGDAHTLYFPPTPYGKFFLIRPFAFISTVDQNGNQVIMSGAETRLLTQAGANTVIAYNQITNVQVSAYTNQVITAINGMSPIQFIANVGNRMGTSKDQGARFNNGLANFQFTAASQTDFLLTETYTIGGKNVTLPLFYFVEQLFNGLTDFQTNIPFNANTKRQSGSDYIPRELRLEQRTKKLSVIDHSAIFNQDQSSKKRAGPATTTLISSSLENSAVCSTLIDNQNNPTAVLKISTFAPAQTAADAWTTSLLTTIETCITNAQQNNIKNLLLDMVDNGGGIICAQYAAQFAIFQDLDPNLNNNLWDPYDEKEGSINNQLQNLNFRGNSAQFLNPATTPATLRTGTTYYSPPTTFVRGGISDSYSPKSFFPSECQPLINQSHVQGVIINQNYAFQKVALLTDGLCGSACSQFASKLRYYGYVATIGMGGILTLPMETSSFTGGNVEDWNAFVPEVAMYNANLLAQLPTSAFTRFNYAEFYLGNEPLPREFQRIQPDYRITSWNFMAPDYLKATDAFYNGAITWPVAALGTHYNPATAVAGTGAGDLNPNGGKIETGGAPIGNTSSPQTPTNGPSQGQTSQVGGISQTNANSQSATRNSSSYLTMSVGLILTAIAMLLF